LGLNVDHCFVFPAAADAEAHTKVEELSIALADSLLIALAPACFIEQPVRLHEIIGNRFGKIAALHLPLGERRVEDGCVRGEIQKLKQFTPVDRHRQSASKIAIME